MIGNRYACGEAGYTLLEEGHIDRQSLQLVVEHWLVCRPDGSECGRYADRQTAEQVIEGLSAGDFPAE